MSADRRARARLRNPDGFTVVEVLVVTLIIAVLLGIAVVTFLGAAHAAQDRAAQSTARQALGTGKALFGAAEDYTAATVSALEEAEPELDFVPAATPATARTW